MIVVVVRVATLAEAGLQELERELPLRLGHLLEGKPLAWEHGSSG